MTLQELANQISSVITDFGHTLAPDIPAEVIRFGLAGLLGALAFVLLVAAMRMLRRSGSRSIAPDQKTSIPDRLRQAGAMVDLLASPNDAQVAVRGVVTSAKSSKITCEIIERLDVLKAKEGTEINCVFAPMKTESGKINSFTATLLESDKSGRRADRIVLSAPTAYDMIPRRKHSRKKVADQQFIRVKIWVTDPHSADINFEDATPHIGVNSFATDAADQGANAVINISNGGLGLSIRNKVIPETCGVGATVTINLFMFNFREKNFKPYWYSGLVRSMEEGRPGFTRMGIKFDGNGQPFEETGQLRWTKF